MVKKYVSDFNRWLIKYKQDNPTTEQQQRQGRALLWDRPPVKPHGDQSK